MLVERTVFQAKYGRGDELVALFQELNGRIRDEAGGEQAHASGLSPMPPDAFLPSSPSSRWRTSPPGSGYPVRR